MIVVALTGSLLAFLPEFDRAVSPGLFPGLHGPELDPATLARRAEMLVPGVRATTVYLGYRGTAQVGVAALPGFEKPGFDQIFLNATTGAELGRVSRSQFPATAGEIRPFIYRLHYELALGPTGALILGLVALAWTIDCFISFALTFPRTATRARRPWLSRWKASWVVKRDSSTYRTNYDLHRASGLWLWPLLFVFAWSSVFFGLNDVYTKVTQMFFEYEPPAFAQPALPPDGRPILEWEEAQVIARNLMAKLGRENNFTVSHVEAFYQLKSRGVYEYRVHSSRDIGDRYGSTSIVLNAYTGQLISMRLPTGSRFGDTLTTWLTELHMANVFGFPYRIVVALLGIAISVMACTGVYIWWKKRASRKVSHELAEPEA